MGGGLGRWDDAGAALCVMYCALCALRFVVRILLVRLGWIVSDCHCLCRSEIPPAGAPAGFDCAAVGGCRAHRHALQRRSAQDDTKADGCVVPTSFIRLR